MHYESLTVLAEGEDLAVISPRRRREAAGFGSDALTRIDLLARLRIIADQEAAIEERVVVVAVHQPRGAVGPKSRVAPGDELVASFALLQGDVTGGAGPDRVHGTDRIGQEARGDEQESVNRERRRDLERRHPRQFPLERPVKTVGPHLTTASRHDLRPERVLPYERCGPVAALLTGHTPDDVTGPGVIGDQRRLLIVVVDDVDTILMDDW